MELSAFAEQVLFAASLEQKLEGPGAITDEHPRPAIVTPAAPGRPQELQFKSPGARNADFPQAKHLQNDRDRGRLLHFFANHELLATELMALVLLKFPEAPAAFRRGVLETLKDEQVHTKLYLRRMQECGIEFGELPVSGYFWRAVSPMCNPLDYVTALSLTFEQANLDFCRDFAQRFEAAGDSITARLLGKIYRDEIGHVAHGLKWFRRWKNPSESDWDAFCRQLKFPLSPQRAKGLTLNVEGRRRAGLDQEFIDRLNTFSQSKGRTPTVFLFNPFPEARIANGARFSPSKAQVMLAEDLANLPQFLCRQDDVVIVPKRPAIEFLAEIKAAGFAIPEFVEEIRTLEDRKLGGLCPWAWDPESIDRLGAMFGNLSDKSRTPESCFNPSIAELYSKAWSTQFLRDFVLCQGRGPGERAWLCGPEMIGRAVQTVSETLSAITAIRARGHHRVVIKQALGSAGGSALRLWEPELLENQRRWIARAVDAGMTLIVEPWLERELDFSLQLEMRSGGLKLCGWTGLRNDLKGQFQANWAAPDFSRRIPAAVAAHFKPDRDSGGALHRLYSEIIRRLAAELARVGFLGPLGIDAFVYRAADGTRTLKPIVEINPRYTMGRLTVELMKQSCPGSFGEFRLINRAALAQAGTGGFPEYVADLKSRYPLRLEGTPKRRIREGVICLNDPAKAQACLAVFQVSRARS